MTGPHDSDTADTREPLERLAELVPLPRPSLADDVAACGRSGPYATGAAAVGSAALAVLVVVAAGVALSGDAEPGAEPPVAGDPTRAPTSAPPPSPGEGPRRDRVRAAVSATAIRALLADLREGEPGRITRLFIRGPVCPGGTSTPERSPCRTWTARERDALVSMLDDVAPVRLLPRSPMIGGPLGRGDIGFDGTPHVTVARLRVESPTAGTLRVVGFDGVRDCLASDYLVEQDDKGRWATVGVEGSVRQLVC